MTRLVVLIGMLGVVRFAAADDPVTLKVREPAVGDRIRVTDEETETAVTVFEAGGKKQDRTEKKSKLVVYVEEVLKAGEPGQKPTKVRRTYEKFETGKDGKAEKSPLEGKTVLIEKKGERYEFTFDAGAAVPAEVAVPLEREFNRGGNLFRTRDLLPEGPVKVGDTWKLDTGKLLADVSKSTGMEFDTAKATASGKLVKAEVRDGRRFGVAEMRLTAPVKGIAGKTPAVAKEGSEFAVTITYDGSLDGTDVTASANAAASFKIEATVMGVDVKLTSEVKSRSKREPAAKK